MHEESWISDDDNFKNLQEDYIFEDPRVMVLSQALSELNAGKDFSFYDLILSAEEKSSLKQFKFDSFNNIVIYTLEEVDVTRRISSELSKIVISGDVYFLSNFITKLLSNVLTSTEHSNAELIIRTESAHIDEKPECNYWHIDKSLEDIFKSFDSNISFGDINDSKNLFITTLQGKTTLYQEVNNQQREQFLKISNNTDFVYGYSHHQACLPNDEINNLFYSNEILNPPQGFGSVHRIGRSGAIHSAPHDKGSRLICLITPM